MSEWFGDVARRALADSTRNQDIPEDIWDAAQAAFNQMDPEGSSNLRDPLGTVARAILAEREACASIDFVPALTQYEACTGDDGLPCESEFCPCKRTATNIAAAIRNRGAA